MKNEVLADLKTAAEELGTTQVGLVKLCVVAFLRWMKENRIRRIPDDWAQIIEDLDGRKTRYRNGGVANQKVAEVNPPACGTKKKKKRVT